MRSNWVRYKKWCVAISSGGVTLGILQGFEMVSFSDLFTQLLSYWLSLLVTLLFGGDISALL